MWSKLAVALLLVLGFAAWLVGVTFLALTMMIAVLGQRLEVEGASPYGNCWTYALPRWYAHGGYLLVRSAGDIRLLGVFHVPHVAWVKVLPQAGLEIEQFDPIKRSKSKWFPWRTIWYHGRVKTVEVPHPIDL